MNFSQLGHDKKAAVDSIRNLELKFDYTSHEIIYSATVNTSNVGFWKGENFTVQVLGLKKDRLTLNVCESGKNLFTIVLKDTDNVPDLKDEPAEAELIKSIMRIKNFAVHSTANLNVNCTAEVDDEPSAGSRHFTFVFIWILILSKILLI